MKKNVSAMLLASCLFITIAGSSFSTTAFAASTATASIQGQTGAPGDTVTAALNLTAGENIDNGQFDLVYDSSKLEIVSADCGDLIASTTHSINPNYSQNTIRGAFATGNPINPNGCLMSVKFKIKADAPEGVVDLTLQNVQIGNDAGEHLTVTCNNGSIQIKNRSVYTVKFDTQGGSAVADAQVVEGGSLTAPAAPVKAGHVFDSWYQDAACSDANLWDFTNSKVVSNTTLYAKWLLTGDVNFDGIIDSFDASLIIKYYTGRITLTPKQIAVADINSDGIGNSFDANIIIQNYTAKP